MTTIAYRWGVLAADSRMMLGGWKSPYDATKLHRLPDGTVCGVVGEYSLGIAFVEWLQSREVDGRPSLEGASVVHLAKDGTITVHEGGGAFPIGKPDFGAWGSGMPAALAAMHMGADARKAVEIAALLDDSTGGPVVFMKCEV
jgi:hypothetical protein